MSKTKCRSSNHGGRRPGAGRKTTVRATERITITLRSEDVKHLDSLAENRSEAVRKLIERDQRMNKQQAQQVMKEMEERGINDVQLFHYGPGSYSVSGQDPAEGGQFLVRSLEAWNDRKRDAELDWGAIGE